MCPIPSAGGVSSVGHAVISLLTRPIVSMVAALAYTLESVESDSDACSQHSTSESHVFIESSFSSANLGSSPSSDAGRTGTPRRLSMANTCREASFALLVRRMFPRFSMALEVRNTVSSQWSRSMYFQIQDERQHYIIAAHSSGHINEPVCVERHHKQLEWKLVRTQSASEKVLAFLNLFDIILQAIVPSSQPVVFKIELEIYVC